MTKASLPSPLLWLLAAVRFVAELGLLAALAWVGWGLGAMADLDEALSMGLSVILAASLAGMGTAVWGRWVAPRSEMRLEDPRRLVVEVTLFGLAAVGLLVVGPAPASTVTAAALVVAYAVSMPARHLVPEE